MFHFAPPAKVARTQRLSSVNVSHQREEVQQSEAPRQTAANRFSTRAVELDTNHATAHAARGGRSNVEAVDRGLSGVGHGLAWITYHHHRVSNSAAPQTGRLWHIGDSGASVTAAHEFTVPVFAPHEGVPRFAAEWVQGSTLLYCSSNGAVKSVDQRVEFQFELSASPGAGSGRQQLSITAFAVYHTPDNSATLVIAATESGLVLCYELHVQSGQASIVSGDSGAVGVDVRQSASLADHSATSGMGWLSWLTGVRSGGARSSKSAKAVPQVSHVHLTAGCCNVSPSTTTRIWAAAKPHHLLLLQRANAEDLSLVWGIDIAQTLQRRSLTILALYEVSHGVLLLAQCDDGVAAGDADVPELLLATVSLHTATLVNCVVLSGAATMFNACSSSNSGERVSYAGIQSADAEGKHVAILINNYAVHINNAAGVRNPCLSEDVVQFAADGSSLIAARLLSNGNVVSLDAIDGAQCTNQNSVLLFGSSQRSPPSVHATPAASSHECSLSRFGAVTATHMAQRVAGVLSAARIDSRHSMDEVVLNAAEEVLQYVPLHEANWARVNLNAEDSNLFTHVTRHLQTRQHEHFSFLCELNRHSSNGTAEVWSHVTPPVAAKLYSDQEKLQCLVAIRDLQNVSAKSSSISTGENVACFFDSIRSCYSDGSAVAESGVLQRAQAMLREATVCVADCLRTATPDVAKSFATAAELTFAHPDNVCLLLRSLNTILADRWSQQLSADTIEAKTADSIAVAAIGRMVTAVIARCRSSKEMHCTDGMESHVWTSGASSDNNSLSVCIADLLALLGDTLAVTHSTAAGRIAPSVQLAPLRAAIPLSEALFGFYRASLSNTDAKAVASQVLFRSFVREPFVDQTCGFPFGAPKCEAPFVASKEVIVREALRLASDFGLHNVLALFACGSYAPDPEMSDGHFSTLSRMTLDLGDDGDAFLRHCMHTMLDQDRETELLALPALLPGVSELASRARDSFLRDHAPHLHWQCVPHAFASLRKEGAQQNPALMYGETLLEHRSRCLSVAKLGWLAAGAPTSVKSYLDLETDIAIVDAQRTHLQTSAAQNSVFSLATIVHELASSRPRDACKLVCASRLAGRAQEPLRGELHAAIVAAALTVEEARHIEALQGTVVSEREFVEALDTTVLGTVIAGSTALKDVREFEAALQRHTSADVQTRVPELLKVVMSWLALRTYT